MQLNVKVIPGAKKNFIKEEAGALKVYLQAPPVEGKANEALIELLAEHFAVRKRQVVIIKGLKSRNKVVKIGAI